MKSNKYKPEVNVSFASFLMLLATFLISCDSTNTQGVASDEQPESENFLSVTIGSQTWLGKNLDISKFRNGDMITQVKSIEDWVEAGKIQKPAWCYYSNNDTIGREYGKLYNWYAVNDPRGLAPKGWRVASETDWKLLVEHLGENGGMKLKKKRYWKEDFNEEHENIFLALPSGSRNIDGKFMNDLGMFGDWWTSTARDSVNAVAFYLQLEKTEVGTFTGDKNYGLAVRCIKE